MESTQPNATSGNSINTPNIYTVQGSEGGMVGMDCQGEMVEMDSQEAKEKRETLVCRDHLAFKVCIHFDLYIPICEQ